MYTNTLSSQVRLHAQTLGAVIILVCVLIACQKEAVEEPMAPTAMVDSVASADSVMVYYEVHGSNDRTLVLIHGWGSDRSYWSAQVDELEGDFRVVALDLAGHGESGMNREDWTMAAYGADVAAVVNDLDLNDAILVAHSMGGAVAIEAARLLPGKVTAIVGVDTHQDLVTPMDSANIERQLNILREDFVTNTEKFARYTFAANADTALVTRISKDLASMSHEVGIASFADLFHYDAAERLKEAQVPIRCINADMNPTNVDGNRSVCESFEVVIMADHGHWLHIVDSDRFNGLLRMTLEEFWPSLTAP